MRFYYANERTEAKEVQNNLTGRKEIRTYWTIRIYDNKADRDTYVAETAGASVGRAKQVTKCDFLRYMPHGGEYVSIDELKALRAGN